MSVRRFRGARIEYQGAATNGHGLKVYVQRQVLQGPAGWQNTGLRESLQIPWSRLAADDVTAGVDLAVRQALKRAWAVQNEDIGLFD